jgi:rhodanese-related sulfurtransferase
LISLKTSSAPADYKELVANGAQIVDVRTKGEYQSGHLKGSVNIPLQVLPQNLSKIRKDKPVIVCCASGMRSGSAKGILSSNGYAEVYNGGSWNSLQSQL